MRERGCDAVASGQTVVLGSCEESNEISDCIKDWASEQLSASHGGAPPWSGLHQEAKT
jgi:hypothetical protein